MSHALRGVWVSTPSTVDPADAQAIQIVLNSLLNPPSAFQGGLSKQRAASQNLNGAHVRVPDFWSSPELDRFVWDKDCGGIVN